MKRPQLQPRSLHAAGRRAVCGLLMLGTTALAAPTFAAAADRPIELIVPGPAGGTPDVVSRMIGEQIASRLQQPVIVVNRPGASGFIGVQAAARAQPDGRTLLVGFAQTMALNPVAYKSIPYDPVADFDPIARLVDFELVLVVPASLPVDDVAGLVDWMRNNPERLSFGSFGAGSPSQFAGQLFAQSTGTDAQHVPYKGSGQLITALASGEVQYGFVVLQVAQALADAGRVKLLAVTGQERQPGAQAVPTLNEAGYGSVQATGWYGLYAPKGTPTEALARIGDAARDALADSALQQKLLQQGVRPAYLGRPEVEGFTQREIEHWRGVVDKTGFEAQD